MVGGVVVPPSGSDTTGDHHGYHSLAFGDRQTHKDSCPRALGSPLFCALTVREHSAYQGNWADLTSMGSPSSVDVAADGRKQSRKRAANILYTQQSREKFQATVAELQQEVCPGP